MSVFLKICACTKRMVPQPTYSALKVHSNIETDIKKIFLFLAMQVNASILLVSLFMSMARLNYGITLNQNTTMKTN